MKKDADKFPHELFVQRAVIKYLLDNGWSKNLKETDGHGPDISVTHGQYSRGWVIECKGGSYAAKSPSGSASVNFHLAIGQIVMRIKNGKRELGADKGGNKIGVAYPYIYDFYRHLKKVSWKFCKVVNLYIFFVKEDGTVDLYDWQRIKNRQQEIIDTTKRLKCNK